MGAEARGSRFPQCFGRSGGFTQTWSRTTELLRVSTLSGAIAIATLAGCGGTQGASQKENLGKLGGTQLVYRGIAYGPSPPTGEQIARTAVVLRERLRARGLRAFSVTSAGDRIIVNFGGAFLSGSDKPPRYTRTSRLEFYDWEAVVLLPDGKTVADQLQNQNPQALTISQGEGSRGPGAPGAGSTNLYTAATVLAKQPPQPFSYDLGRKGTLYFLFGKPGSAACKAAAKAQGIVAPVGAHCLLAGPDQNVQDLKDHLPIGVGTSEPGVQLVTVPQGYAILQAVPSNFAKPLTLNNPSAQFYAIRDHVSLFGPDITNPQQSTDQTGSPDVAFGFTAAGAAKFRRVTAAIAHRGALVSGLGQTLDQHFAVALDTQLITVPSIDFKVYPDGVTGGNGAQITGGFTKQSAQDFATELRLGALPLSLGLIATKTSQPSSK